MDELLPKVLLETLQIFSIGIGILLMVIIVNHWMIIPMVFICGSFYVIRIYYLKTAQDIKCLEGISESIFKHVCIISQTDDDSFQQRVPYSRTSALRSMG